MAGNKAPAKLGAEHASAMFRQGLAELRAALYPESNVAQPTVYGMAGTKTPGEVMEDRKGENRDPDEKPSILNERLEQVSKDCHESEPEPPQPERD